MCLSRLILAAAACIAVRTGGAALADSVTWHMPGEETCLSSAASPFAPGLGDGGQMWLEKFEDGLLNLPGIASLSGGIDGEPGRPADSVDGDGDGRTDGRGTGGYSPFGRNPGGASTEFGFDADILASLPTFAGFVWTDSNADPPITSEAFNSKGAALSSIRATLGNGAHHGSTATDRLLGAELAGGISAMKISAAFGSLRIDHPQYRRYVVVPLPAPVAMGLAGLAVVAVIRRRD